MKSRKERDHRYYLKHKSTVLARQKKRYQNIMTTVRGVRNTTTPRRSNPRQDFRINLTKFESGIRAALMNKQPYLFVRFDSDLEAISID